jgi:hypothetical protein
MGGVDVKGVVLDVVEYVDLSPHLPQPVLVPQRGLEFEVSSPAAATSSCMVSADPPNFHI